MTPEQKAEIFEVSHLVLETLAGFAKLIVEEKFTDHGFDGNYSLKLQFWLFERSHDFVVDHEDPCEQFEMEGSICCLGRNAHKKIHEHFFDVVVNNEVHGALCRQILQRDWIANLLAYEGLGTVKYEIALFPRIVSAQAA